MKWHYYEGEPIPPTPPAPLTVNYSCRFDSASSAYLSQTYTTNSTVTFSSWIKRAKLGTTTPILDDTIYFNSSDQLVAFGTTSTMLFRDISNWYHIHISNNGVYVNGASIGMSITTASFSDKRFGYDGSNYADIYFAETILIDESTIAYSSFGEFSDDGQWSPLEYSGSYGTNGFYLDFADSADLGEDVSGQGNHWTSNNLATTDQMLDTPSNNYCISIGDLAPSGSKISTIAEGGLKLTCGIYTVPSICSTFSVSSGKWYAEMKNVGGHSVIGLINTEVGTTTAQWLGQSASGWTFHQGNGYVYHNNSGTPYGSAYFTNNIIGIALDMDNGKVYWRINGVWQNSGDPAAETNPAFTGLTGSMSICVCGVDTSSTIAYLNYGQDSAIGTGEADENEEGNFAYEPPAGFLALCSNNLSASAVVANEGFDVITRTGTSAEGSISTLLFSPNLFVGKNRDAADEWKCVDSERGVTKEINWDSDNIESTDANGLTSFDANGYSLGTGVGGYNDSGEDFVDYLWLEDPAFGCDIVAYTGTGAAKDEAHSLVVEPECIIVKSIDGANDWAVYHKNLDASAPEDKYVRLNESTAVADDSTYWNDTAPTSSVFSIGTNADVNTNADDYIAYLFASVEGFSKFGSYVGNGNADGPLIELCFKPKMVIVKNIDTTGQEWGLYDSARTPYNLIDDILVPNTSSAEAGSTGGIDFLSNGFKLRTTHTVFNASGTTYIYLAWAENPFKIGRAV